MNIKRIAAFTLAALLAVGAIGGLALAKDRAHDQDKRDVTALAGMKVTLAQAIATAEQQVGGQAVGADVSQEKGATRISVEVSGPHGMRTVMLDGQTGQVTATHDGGQDSGDDD